MDLLKNKRKGYVLLLVMIITSSIFLLVISVIVKNRLANSVAKTISIKHEQNLLFASALSIIKSLLSFDELSKNNKDNKEQVSELIDKESINKNPDNKNSNKLPLLFFNFYWKECNKWLQYKFNNNKYNLDGTISIYLTIEDGKFPLKKLYNEYEKQINKENKSKENGQNKEEDKKDIDKKQENANNENKSKESNNVLEQEMKKNAYLEKIKPLFKKLEENNAIFKKLLAYKKKDKEFQQNDDSFILKIISNFFKKGHKKSPVSLENALNDFSLKNESIYGSFENTEANKKESGIQDLFSLSNETCSLFYLAPAFIEFLGQKAIILNNDTRKKIIDAGKKYFDKIDSNTIKNDDLWNTLYANVLNIPYQKEFFEIDETQKTYSTDIDLPSCFSALIKIEIINTVFFGIAFFEKNKKYAKNNENDNNQNQEYLIKSIYILPFE